MVAVIDERIQTTAFNAEQALTKDTVPVNVDAIIFWHVHDAEKAALNITNYRQAIDRVAQTSLREMIGSSMLAALLSDRQAADEQLRAEIGPKTADGAYRSARSRSATSRFPVALQDAMSRQAQAEREKQARVILGSAEADIAGNSSRPPNLCGHPIALQLRAMNIIYETTKERGATILMPTSMVDSLNVSPTTLAVTLAATGLLPEAEVVKQRPAEKPSVMRTPDPGPYLLTCLVTPASGALCAGVHSRWVMRRTSPQDVPPVVCSNRRSAARHWRFPIAACKEF